MQGFQPIYTGSTLSNAAANAAAMRAKYASSPLGEGLRGLAGLYGAFKQGQEEREKQKDRNLDREHKAAQTQLLTAQAAYTVRNGQDALNRQSAAYDALGPTGASDPNSWGSGVGDGTDMGDTGSSDMSGGSGGDGGGGGGGGGE